MTALTRSWHEYHDIYKSCSRYPVQRLITFSTLVNHKKLKFSCGFFDSNCMLVKYIIKYKISNKYTLKLKTYWNFLCTLSNFYQTFYSLIFLTEKYLLVRSFPWISRKDSCHHFGRSRRDNGIVQFWSQQGIFFHSVAIKQLKFSIDFHEREPTCCSDDDFLVSVVQLIFVTAKKFLLRAFPWVIMTRAILSGDLVAIGEAL